MMDYEIPNLSMGLGLAYGLDENINKDYGSLSETDKEHIIFKCKDAKSKDEMDRIIDSVKGARDIEGLPERPSAD